MWADRNSNGSKFTALEAWQEKHGGPAENAEVARSIPLTYEIIKFRLNRNDKKSRWKYRPINFFLLIKTTIGKALINFFAVCRELITPLM
jgi:hypothetical protein